MARFNLLTKLERVFEYISKHDHYSFKQFGLLTAVLVAYRHIPAVRVETSKIIVDTIVAITTFNVGYVTFLLVLKFLFSYNVIAAY